jgi:hypothetical protein
MRNRVFLAIAIVCLVVQACASAGDRSDAQESAASVEPHRFAYEDLVALIDGNGFTRLEEVLSALPRDLRSNYTLMYTSGSLQEASDTNPRVILFGADARLTCAFNGDPSQVGFDSLECFQFRESERSFDFRQIRFPTSSNGLTRVAFSASDQTTDGTVRCSGCHRPDPRPNWDGYNTWAGAYGSKDDGLRAGNEASRYARFVARRAAHPRYRTLIQDTSATAPYTLDGHAADVSFRPNLRFSDAAGRMNAFRAARILESHMPVWRSLAFAVSTFNCTISADQKDALTRSGFDVAKEVDFEKIFASLGLGDGDWGTNVHGGEDPAWEHMSGFTFLINDVVMTIAQERARAGNAVLQQALDRVRASFAAHYTGSKLAFFSTLNDLVPDPDWEGDYFKNIGYVCPELTRVFVEEALQR